MEDSISNGLQQFIAQYVHSVEQLEILCLLGNHSQESFGANSIFQKIQTNEASISERLKKFVSERLLRVEGDGGYRLSPEYHALVTELAKAYRERHVTVIELIYKKPTTSVKDFAEAFRFKKKE